MIEVTLTVPHWLVYGAIGWFLAGCAVILAWHLYALVRLPRDLSGAVEAVIAIAVWPYSLYAMVQALRKARRRTT